MQSTLTIQDLAVTAALDRKQMSAVRGGLANQANGTQQTNTLAMFAPVSVGNGAHFGGGPVNIQVDSTPTQTAHNGSGSANAQGIDWGMAFPGFY